MKKILGAVLSAMVMVIFSGCASRPTGDARDTSAYKQNLKMNLPAWAGIQFKSGWNKDGYFWKGPVDETGFFASGKAKYSDVSTSTSAADLDGKAQIAFFVKQELNAIAKNESDAADSDSKTQFAYKDFQSSVAQVKISGIVRVDRYIADDGTVYVLMFVPSNEIKRAMPSDSEFSQKVMDIYVNGLDEDKN
ncbi:hypothetical protein [uncultured Treponema sp.]|uniref:hypothetical protein n=1 Tax=uncultured Treponema sp. TaxID=162155 RepID=UPI0025D0C27C|nr:hypothetical protein [uncultured Treponema sp.]